MYSKTLNIRDVNINGFTVLIHCYTCSNNVGICCALCIFMLKIWSWKLLKKDFESGKSPPPHISLNRGRQPDDIQIEHEELLVFMRPLLPRIRFSSASLQWLPQQKGLLAVMCGSHVELWDISQKLVECEKCYGTWRAPDEGYHLVNPVTVHNASASIKCAVPSGGYLVIGDTNGQLQVLDIASGEMVQHFQDHKGPVTGLFGVSA